MRILLSLLGVAALAAAALLFVAALVTATEDDASSWSSGDTLRYLIPAIVCAAAALALLFVGKLSDR